MASPQAGAGACPPARTSPSTLRRHRRDTGRQAYQLLKDCRLLGLRAAIGGMPVWTRGGQRETWPVRLPPEQHLRIGDKLPTAAVNKVRGNDRVRRIAPAQRVLIRPGRPVGEGGVSSTSQLPARSVPLRAAMAATSNPRRASKKACITSRPSSVFSAPGATQGAEPGSGPTHRPSPPSLSRSACACCSVSSHRR